MGSAKSKINDKVRNLFKEKYETYEQAKSNMEAVITLVSYALPKAEKTLILAMNTFRRMKAKSAQLKKGRSQVKNIKKKLRK